MNNIFISFIIPVYNAEKYLNTCIESILVQKIEENIEIILVDDGSSDNSGKLCDDYSARYPGAFVVHHQKNTGQGSARNKGMDLAKGKWIVFIDDDDWIDSDWYRYCIPAMKKEPDIVMYCKRDVSAKRKKEYYLKDNKAELFIDNYTEKRKIMLSVLDTYYESEKDYGKLAVGTPWAKIFKSSLLIKNNIRFVEGYGEDRPCLFKAYEAADTILIINKVLHNYLLHESTMRKYLVDASQKYSASMLQMNNYVNSKYSEEYEFKEALKQFNVAWFSYFVRQDYCNKNNKKTYSKRRQDFLTDLQSPPYQDSFTYADFKRLSIRRRILAYLIKYKKFLLIDIMSYLNNLYEKMKWEKEK